MAAMRSALRVGGQGEVGCDGLGLLLGLLARRFFVSHPGSAVVLRRALDVARDLFHHLRVDGLVALRGRDHLAAAVFGGAVEIDEDDHAGHEHPDDGAHGVEGLGEVEAAGRGALVAHREDIGIGRGFQEGQPAGHDEIGEQEGVEVERPAGGNKEQASAGVEGEAQQNAAFVGEFLDEDGRRNGHERVAAVEGALHERTLEVGQQQDVLERRHHRIGDVVGESPEGNKSVTRMKGTSRLFGTTGALGWLMVGVGLGMETKGTGHGRCHGHG
jgi:hypothetical protein